MTNTLTLHHESSAELTTAEAAELTRLEAVIREGLQTFIDVGTALTVIRDQNLYRTDHQTFEDYCEERWGFKKSQAYRLIDAAHVAGILSPIGDVSNEAQARELGRLKDDTLIRETFATLTKQHGPKLTAKLIQQAVQQQIEDKPPRDLDPTWPIEHPNWEETAEDEVVRDACQQWTQCIMGGMSLEERVKTITETHETEGFGRVGIAPEVMAQWTKEDWYRVGRILRDCGAWMNRIAYRMFIGERLVGRRLLHATRQGQAKILQELDVTLSRTEIAYLKSMATQTLEDIAAAVDALHPQERVSGKAILKRTNGNYAIDDD